MTRWSGLHTSGEDDRSKTKMIWTCEEKMHRCPVRRCERIDIAGTRRGATFAGATCFALRIRVLGAVFLKANEISLCNRKLGGTVPKVSFLGFAFTGLDHRDRDEGSVDPVKD
ncbi:hypothetical protein H5410_035562 [Solanum commersonii]|uniref:Uncharacterized protein n=1 Tax=Solanum commersonii TaxID=4109 RepID=A0A9J5Y300_SOLCO|nr:hypothetical protein H5410_035562 [Solanum commersonii]